jgi:hypothetical protein
MANSEATTKKDSRNPGGLQQKFRIAVRVVLAQGGQACGQQKRTSSRKPTAITAAKDST